MPQQISRRARIRRTRPRTAAAITAHRLPRSAQTKETDDRITVLIEQHTVLIRKIAAHVCPNQEEDAFQDAVLKLLEHPGHFLSASNPAGWAVLSTRHRCIDTKRHEQLNRRLDAEQGWANKREASRKEAAETEQMRVAVHELLPRLPKSYREAIELALTGATDAEATEALAITIGAFRSRRYRATARLQMLISAAAS